MTLTWNSVNGATEYDLGVRDVGSDTLVVDTRIVGNSYDARLERGRSYRWNVRACNAQGCSSFTSPLYFSTGDVTAASAPPARGPAAATMVASPNAFPLFNQHDAGNDRLYGSASWASGNDPTLRRPRQRHTLTCLATVYAMLEHGYGRTGYRVGPDTYTDQAGAIQPSSYSVSRHDATGALDEVVRQLYANRPVILHGPIPGDDFGHFILAVGVGPDGRIIAHDPSGGLLVRIDPATRAVTGSNTISTIDGYRIVTP